jgi:hypothetical protein
MNPGCAIIIGGSRGLGLARALAETAAPAI